MIHKNELVGKYIYYKDKDGKHRTEKAIKINGNTLTVQNALKERHRIRHDHDNIKIFGRYNRRSKKVEDIDWSRTTPKPKEKQVGQNLLF